MIWSDREPDALRPLLVKMAELLMSKGGRLDAKDTRGKSLLQVAEGREWPAMVELLRGHGAKP